MPKNPTTPIGRTGRKYLVKAYVNKPIITPPLTATSVAYILGM